MRAITAVLAALGTGLLGWSALRLGFDTISQGGALLSARLLLEGTGSFAGATSPLANAVLGAWMSVAGSSVAALARFDAIVLGCVAGAGAWLWYARAGTLASLAWSTAVLAAAPVPMAAAAALLAIVSFDRVHGMRTRCAVAGVGWVVVAALDFRIALSVLPIIAWALPRAAWRTPALWIAIASAGVSILLITTVIVGGEIAWARGVVAPVEDVVTRLRTGDIGRFVRTALQGMLVMQPFGGWPPTGELPEAVWPGQELARVTALRLVVIFAITGTVLMATRRVARGNPRSGLVFALFATGVLSLALRGDVNGLRLAIVPVGAALIVLAGFLPRMAWAGPAVALVLAAPFAAEAVARGARAGHSGLATWDDPRGGVELEERRARRWGEIRRRLVPRSGEPALVWPVDPGVHWILGTTPVIADAGLPRDPQADRRVAAALENASPRLVLLGPDQALLGHRLLERLPRTWEVLRERYRLAGVVRFENDDLRLLLPFERGLSDPLAQMLPLVELTVANERTPALRSGFQVGQSFRMGPRDLQGFAVRARTRGRDLALDFRIQVWQKRVAGFDSALLSERVSATIAGDGSLVWFRTPLPETANQELAITLELRTEVQEELRLDWYVHDEAHEPDFYPEGTALLGLSPVAADLYFLVY